MSKLLIVLIAWAITQGGGAIAQAISEDGYAHLSVNPVSGAVLAEQNGWIWKRQRETEPWRKLIPGQCPHWTRDGTRFYYFLAVGYDGGRSELWSAGADGEGRLRLTQSDYWVRRPVVVSPEERSLAFYFETSVAAGDFHDVVVIDFRPISVRSSAGRVVLRTHGSVDPSTLRWIAEGRLSVVVDGKTVDVDTNLPGFPQDP
jgi:hypothetical protein